MTVSLKANTIQARLKANKSDFLPQNKKNDIFPFFFQNVLKIDNLANHKQTKYSA